MIELLDKINQTEKILILSDAKSQCISKYLYNKICDLKDESIHINTVYDPIKREEKRELLEDIRNKNYVWLEPHTGSLYDMKLIYSCDIILLIQNNRINIPKCRIDIDRARYTNLDVSGYLVDYVNELVLELGKP